MRKGKINNASKSIAETSDSAYNSDNSDTISVKGIENCAYFGAGTNKVAKKIDEIKTGQEVILYDRIRYLSKVYIRAGEIEFEDRSILHKMYAAYKSLNNGDEDDSLRILIKEIDELRTKN